MPQIDIDPWTALAADLRDAGHNAFAERVIALRRDARHKIVPAVPSAATTGAAGTPTITTATRGDPVNANGHADVLAFMALIIVGIVTVGAIVLPLSDGAWQIWLAVGLFLVPSVAFAARSARQLYRLTHRPSV